MSIREDKQRRAYSNSKEPSSPTLDRGTSYSADKGQRKLEQKVQEREAIERALQRISVNNEWQWRLLSFEQKRSILGFKGRLEWRWRNRDLSAVFKCSFADSYFNQAGLLVEGDLIVELEEVTFELSVVEKRQLQQRINVVLGVQLQPSKRRGNAQQWRRQSEYLRGVLGELGGLLVKYGESRKRVAVDRVDRRLNPQQILYPAPVTFSWNPLGSICITENRFPSMRRALVGQPSALRKYFEASRQEGGGVQGEQQNLQLGGQGKFSVFNWQIEQEASLIIFNRQSSKAEDYFNVRNTSQPEGQQKREQQKGSQDSVDLGSLSLLPAKLRQAYERYFGGGERAVQLHRHDKLKVYDILSLSREDEDDIVYLIERFTARPAGASAAEVAFQNYLTAYPSLLGGPVDRLRFQAVRGQLRLALGNPQLAFGAYLRSFVLENQFVACELQRYFRRQYRVLGLMVHPEVFALGSSSTFDHSRAQLIFMDLLQRFLEKLDSGEGRIRRESFRVQRRWCPGRVSVQGVVSEQQKNNFLMGLFPLLIVKDREMQRFQFKKIKKIVSANARAAIFINKVNQLVGKFQEGRTGFLRNVVDHFRRFREGMQQRWMQPQRCFLAHCGQCGKITPFSFLPSRQELSECQKCRVKLFTESV